MRKSAAGCNIHKKLQRGKVAKRQSESQSLVTPPSASAPLSLCPFASLIFQCSIRALILDRAVAAEAAGRIQWPAGFWSWPLAERIRWATDRLGQSSTSNFSLPTSHFSSSSAHALPFKLAHARRRIGFVTPSFASCGGVETWFLSLASRLTEFDWLIAVRRAQTGPTSPPSRSYRAWARCESGPAPAS